VKFSHLAILVIGLMIEALAFWLFTLTMWFWALFIHGIAGMYFAYCMVRFMPPQYNRTNLPALYLLFALLILLLPMLGAVGCTFFIYSALWKPQQKEAQDIAIIEAPELPYYPVHIEGESEYTPGRLHSLLAASDATRQLEAILTAINIPSKRAVPILRKALKVNLDDIRLLAYSALSKLENDLLGEILKQEDKLISASNTEAGNIHWQLASLHWELAYLYLVTGNILDYILGKSEFHARQAIDTLGDQAPILVLLGKVLLKLEAFDQAADAYKRSLMAGMDEAQVLPYQAELAFAQGCYVEAKSLMKTLANIPHNQFPKSLMEAWV